jgi:ATP-dependent protease HslVU (ClpYQ) peptidase subunit
MTCVVSLKTPDKIYIGADSAAVDGLDVCTVKDEKVFALGDKMLIGFAGSFRVGQVVRYSLKIPAQKPGKSDHEYMCIDFIKALQKTLDDHGLETKGEKEMDCIMLIAYKGEVYEIDSDFRVGIHSEVYNSVGSGRSFALGAMDAIIDQKTPPDKKIQKALLAAAKYNAGVSAPFLIRSTD